VLDRARACGLGKLRMPHGGRRARRVQRLLGRLIRRGQRGQQLPVHHDVGVAPDGRREVRVEAQRQAEVAQPAAAGSVVA